MPFHVGDFFNNIKRNIVENKTIYSLTANPIYISVLIIAIIVMIVALLFDADDFMYSLFKIAVYGTIFVLILMLFHDNAINLDYKEKYGGYHSVFNSEPIEGANDIEIKPIDNNLNNNYHNNPNDNSNDNYNYYDNYKMGGNKFNSLNNEVNDLQKEIKEDNLKLFGYGEEIDLN